MSDEILSVGIDVGTTTTQVIFSKLVIENSADFFTVPKVSIVDKKVIYKGDIVLTPLKSSVAIDVDKLRDIVAREYGKRGFKASDIHTGAVIITGESARKENSNSVLQGLSSFAGDFVVATAGPDLESVIAGKGSGAWKYSVDNDAVVVNMDIGGGTTNVSLFDSGEVLAKGCWDIGGRSVRLDDEGRIVHISDSAKTILESLGLGGETDRGRKLGSRKVQILVEKMAQLLAQIIGLCPVEDLLQRLETGGSSKWKINQKPDAIFFSGGVADAAYGKSYLDDFHFGDIGIVLGKAIARDQNLKEIRWIKPSETIRATVVGAGTHTTKVTGSTIYFDKGLLPLKNIPVVKMTQGQEKDCYSGKEEELVKQISWFTQQSDAEKLVLAFKGLENPEYMEVVNMAASLARAHVNLTAESPLIVCLENDMAKALGQQLRRKLGDRADILCIDGIKVEENDYIDFGQPVMNDLVIPIIVKTLIFG